jgi:two-component sensor histidine kinase
MGRSPSALNGISSVSRRMPRNVDICSARSIRKTTIVDSRRGSLHAIPQVASREIDASLYMFALCTHLQMIFLDRCGIHCVVDAGDAGRLPETICRMLGFIVRELVCDASRCSKPEMAGGTVSVILRRRETTCICTVSRHCLAPSCACAQPGLQRSERFAAEFSGSCVIRPMPDRGITCIVFDVDAA